jgi:MFS family permease
MQRPPAGRLELRSWLDPAIVGIALVGVAAGFGQFGAVAALGDVAKSFGRITHGATIADQAGLSGTALGVGLAILRLASLAALPLTALADRLGRRRTMLASCALGLVATVGAAFSPSYWWFVAIFALGRPLLSTANALGSLAAAEHADARNRARAVALVTAGYGIGAGATAVLHSAASSVLGFRNLFAIAAVPLVGLLFVRRMLRETDRYLVASAEPAAERPRLGAVGGLFRRRLVVLAAISFAVALTTGPATSFVFIYAQNVRGLRGAAVVAMVLGAGVAGFLGLVSGGWLADHVGRRLTGALAMMTIALAGMAIYSGSVVILVVGYIASVFFASNLAPAAGSLVNELFPTTVRAVVAGWLVAASVIGAVLGLLLFGAVADVGGRFSSAALVTFAATIPLAGLFALLPETRGLEPEQVAAR